MFCVGNMLHYYLEGPTRIQHFLRNLMKHSDQSQADNCASPAERIISST